MYSFQMLSEASARTKAKKEVADTLVGVTVIAPTIQRKSHIILVMWQSCDDHMILWLLCMQHPRSHWGRFLPTSPRCGYRTCFDPSALCLSFRPRTSGALLERSPWSGGRPDSGSWFATLDLWCSLVWTREDQQRLVRCQINQKIILPLHLESSIFFYNVTKSLYCRK